MTKLTQAGKSDFRNVHDLARSCTSGVCQLTVVCQESKSQMRLVTAIVKIMSQRLVIFMFRAKYVSLEINDWTKKINTTSQTILKETFNPLKAGVLFFFFLTLQACRGASQHAVEFKAFYAHTFTPLVICWVVPHPVTFITSDIEATVLRTIAASSALIQFSVSWEFRF